MEGPSFYFDLCNISFSDFQFVGTSRFASLYMEEECLSFNPPKIWKDSKTGSRDYFYFVKILKNQRNFNFENFQEGISKTQHQGSFNNFKNPQPPQNQRTAQHWFKKIPRVSKKEFQIRTEEQGSRKTHERDRPKTKKRNKQG